MTNAGRHPIIATWGLSVQANNSQAIMGEGGGAAGWSPKWPMILHRATLQGYDYANTLTAPHNHFIVTKNGVAGSDELYNLDHTMNTTPGATNEGYLLTDSTTHIITPDDYLVARVGHLTAGTGTSITAQAGTTLEGTYLTGPLSGQGPQHINKRGHVRLFHIHGGVSVSERPFWLLGLGTKIFNASSQSPVIGWPVPCPMILRRLILSYRVHTVVPLPDDNEIRLSLFVDDDTSTADMEISTKLNAFKAGSPTVKGTTMVDSSNTLFLELREDVIAGTGTSQVLEISVTLEVEYV